MSNSLDQTDVDRVRDATDLVRLIGEHVSLRPRGREHVGLCPFHEDRRPSLAVVTHKGQAFYKCFACGASGDCFRFVMDYHKMDFVEALRHLADRAGIPLRPRSVRPADGAGPTRADLLKATEFAGRFFRQVLADPVTGVAARAVLEKRGIGAPMIERFGIGAAPARPDALAGALSAKRSALTTAEAAGLVRTRSGGAGHYDTFRNRLIFPIRDEMGRPIAFGARAIDPDDVPKYLNSPETPLFHKSRSLYGLDLAKRAIIDSRQAIVTEGYTDVIACHQAGITNVVGTLGTALSNEHAALLARLCDSVVLVFDGDEAGRKAADRAVAVFFAEPVDVRICVLPEGLDPDDLLRLAGGFDRFHSAIASAADALEYKLRRFEVGLADGGVSARQRRLQAFLDDLADLGFTAMAGVRKGLVLNRLAELLGLPAAEIERALPRRRRAAAAAAHRPPAPGGSALLAAAPGATDVIDVSRARRIAEHDVLALLLFEPDVGSEALGDLTPADFSDRAARKIAEMLLPAARRAERITVTRLLAQVADEDVRSLASRLYFDGDRSCGGDPAQAPERLAVAAGALRRRIEHEQYERQIAANRTATATPAEPPAVEVPGAQRGESEEIIHLIRQRERLGNRPAAISRGVRS